MRLATALALCWASTATLGSDVRTIEIKAKEFSFSPERIEVEQGRTVRLELVNAGKLSHNLHIEGAAAKTGTIQAGNAAAVTFTPDKRGTVRFFCDVPGHEQAGMTGRLIVK
jgi:uncharacterized cupredoxin-like copper-binding protein